MPSFDVVSIVDMHEVTNAVDQARREIVNRFDFKGSNCEIDFKSSDGLIALLAEDKLKLNALLDIMKLKLAKRQVSLKSVEVKDPVSAGGDALKQDLVLKMGLNSDELKRMTKLIKGRKFKVTAQIQGDQLRVSAKKRDELQNVIGFLKEEVQDLELKFENFRD